MKPLELLLTQATGPDGELNRLIHEALGHCTHRHVIMKRELCCIDCGASDIVATSLPDYTGSLDAALTLLPKGSRWLVGAGHPYESPWANVRLQQGGPLHLHAVTPAIALCLTILKLRGLLC